MAMLTLDGVNVMGERLAGEVLEVINQKPCLRKISVVAHYLGGLWAKYAIGKLYRQPRDVKAEDLSANSSGQELKTTIAGHEPINFITIATPHFGMWNDVHNSHMILYHRYLPFTGALTAAVPMKGCYPVHLLYRSHCYLRS